MKQEKRWWWKIRKQTWIIIGLVVLLVVAGGYVGMGKYNDLREEKELGLFQQGAQYGFEQAVIQIAGMAISCDQVPLRVENQTINMIAVDCLNVREGNQIQQLSNDGGSEE